MSLTKLFTGVRPKVGRTIQQIFTTVIPSACEHCDKTGPLLCKDCHTKLEWIHSPICTNCGNPLLNALDVQCKSCSKENFATDSICTPLWYHGAITSLIQALKYQGHFGVADPVIDLISPILQQCNEQFEMIVPLALHSQRQQKRGYNQSAVLGRALAKRLGIPMVEDGLFRQRSTRSQVRLTAVQRAANMHGAFWANPTIVQNQAVLLLDDVYTTGATMQAAATALKEAGASAVHAVCIARAYVPTVHHYKLNHPIVEGTVI